ncbi:MAG: hypothetical protein A2W91_14435 [Bacteroidetes bacterium GWF2_38_335]|nr:MAG: hypothetical protein A2W91_14435 [Bacteroidetes bacterium GWF2_38_335]OFY79343.1 MAG: hypothetical protein A2281_16720 [Bacteroidetes bacterium RIFOXYA12_FULL_38_20]HBS85602.1 hypothetical protein [Bacteroidales bacterium]
MNQKEEQLEALKDIRNLMERSSKFLTLNGFAGVFVGIIAMAGGVITLLWLDNKNMVYEDFFNVSPSTNGFSNMYFLFAISGAVLFFSILVSSIMTMSKAKKKNYKIWDATTRKVLFHFFLPMVVGGILCLIFVHKGLFPMVAPFMLIFFGLALISCSKYTFNELKVLGIIETILGLIAAVYLQYGLYFWMVGFGLLNIIYGLFMFFKYEKNIV